MSLLSAAQPCQRHKTTKYTKVARLHLQQPLFITSKALHLGNCLTGTVKHERSASGGVIIRGPSESAGLPRQAHGYQLPGPSSAWLPPPPPPATAAQVTCFYLDSTITSRSGYQCIPPAFQTHCHAPWCMQLHVYAFCTCNTPPMLWVVYY